MAQQVKDSGVVNCGGLGHCCSVDSITVLGTSTCCGSRAKKKKKKKKSVMWEVVTYQVEVYLKSSGK